MKTVSELFETPISSPAYWENVYELHQLLGWKPWQPPPASVWESPTPTAIWRDGDDFHCQPSDWSRLRAELEALHAEYLKRKEASE